MNRILSSHKKRIGMLAVLSMTGALSNHQIAQANDFGLRPFAASSPWNTVIPAAATFQPAGNACTDDIRDQNLGTDINAAQWSQPVEFARSNDPLQRIWVRGRVVARLRIPRKAQPSLPKWPLDRGADSHLNIIDPGKNYVHELWRAQKVRGGFVAQYYVRNDLRGSGVGSGGTRAYGGSAIGGLIRLFEAREAVISHALALALPREKMKPGFVAPATAEDDGSIGTYLGNVPMGTRIGLAPTVNVAALGLTPIGTAIARALQTYGAYVVDASSDLSFSAEPRADQLIAPARGDLATLKSLLQCVK